MYVIKENEGCKNDAGGKKTPIYLITLTQPLSRQYSIFLFSVLFSPCMIFLLLLLLLNRIVIILFNFVFCFLFNISIFKCYYAPFLNISDVCRISYQWLYQLNHSQTVGLVGGFPQHFKKFQEVDGILFCPGIGRSLSPCPVITLLINTHPTEELVIYTKCIVLNHFILLVNLQRFLSA